MNVSSDALNKRRTTMTTQEATQTETATAKKAKANKKSAKATKPAKAKKAAKTAMAKNARSGSKAEKVLELMKRKEGATLAEIAKATDWQNHSIRGFVSGHVTNPLSKKPPPKRGGFPRLDHLWPTLRPGRELPEGWLQLRPGTGALCCC
jgi:hypothetical protein